VIPGLAAVGLKVLLAKLSLNTVVWLQPASGANRSTAAIVVVSFFILYGWGWYGLSGKIFGASAEPGGGKCRFHLGGKWVRI
jgi:hypothetical protein